MAHQFWANSEFFADFGQYDVRMTVPSGYIVGATGIEQSRMEAANGAVAYRYTQADVHDFAWTASPDFIEKRKQFSMPGRAPVQMRLLIQPEHEHLAERHFAGAEAALQNYGEWWRLSLSHAHHRRSAVPERSRRDGVSDDLHGRYALAVAAIQQRS